MNYAVSVLGYEMDVLTAVGVSEFLSRSGAGTPRWPRAAEGEMIRRPLRNVSVLKTVLRKYEAGETREVGEIFANTLNNLRVFNMLKSREAERVLPEEPKNQ